MEKKAAQKEMRVRKKGLLCVLLCAVCLLCGCDAPEYHYEVRRDLSVYFGNADSVIQSVRTALRSHSPGITITYRSDRDNMDDIPALIKETVTFAMSETNDPREGDYIYWQYGGYELEYSYEKSSGGYEYSIYIIPKYYTDIKQEQTVSEMTADILLSLSLEGRTDREKVRLIYEYVRDNVKYDIIHKKNDHYHLKNTAYAALVNGCAVCQGFSVLMYRLLREAGINARIIAGNAVSDGGSEYHAWNIAEIEGKYYNIDVTWASLTGSDDYYMKGEESFSKDHIRGAEYSQTSFYRSYPMSLGDLEY